MVASALEGRARRLASGLGLVWVRSLRASARKQTIVAEVRLSDGRAAVLKLQSPERADRAASAAFERERRFYEASSFALAPPLLQSDPRFILIERIAGLPLREWLRASPVDAIQLTSQLLRIIDAFAERRYRGNRAHGEWAAHRCSERIYNLLISGPIDGRRSRIGHSVVSQVSRFWVPSLRPALVHLHARWVRRGVRFTSDFGHNDLHTSNVISSEAGPYVVDYENVTRPGFWLVDVLYLFATTYAALADVEQRRRLLDVTVGRLLEQEPMAGPELAILARLFASAALSNGRFRGSTWYNRENISSLLRLLQP
jgi:hypothetical protein